MQCLALDVVCQQAGTHQQGQQFPCLAYQIQHHRLPLPHVAGQHVDHLGEELCA